MVIDRAKRALADPIIRLILIMVLLKLLFHPVSRQFICSRFNWSEEWKK